MLPLASKIPAVVPDHKVAQEKEHQIPPLDLCHQQAIHILQRCAILQQCDSCDSLLSVLRVQIFIHTQEDLASMLKELWNKRK